MGSILGRVRPLALAVLVVSSAPRSAIAGMPQIMLTDVARARFQVISFFLTVLLLCAWGVKGIWNSLARDFSKLPRLSFGKACGLITLWGLLFVLVLTMISGARELLTPGAWEKVGLTSRLATETTPQVAPLPERRQVKLERLRAALWAYARAHDGRFPPDDSATAEVSEDVWRTPNSSALRYRYVPGRRVGDGYGLVVAYEPDEVGGERFALTTIGTVERMSAEEILKSLGDAKGAP
ncbi:MAG: hypothetical protein AB7I30_15265 [Isosphaeraceae bacterium]